MRHPNKNVEKKGKGRKVLAQRKFAQGAYVPPTLTVSSIGTDRRVDISPIKEKSVFHNKTSARSLLDIVAFKNLHRHAQPIVLLERLENSHPLCTKDRTYQIVSPKLSDVTTKKTDETNPPASNNTDTEAIPEGKKKSCDVTPRLPMQLRSRIITYKGEKVLPNKKKNTIDNRKKVVTNLRNSRILRKEKQSQDISDDFSIDDNKPLTFFRKKALQLKKNDRASLKKKKSIKKTRITNSEPKRSSKRKIVRRVQEPQDVEAELDTSSNLNPDLVPKSPSSDNLTPTPEPSSSNKDVDPNPAPTNIKIDPVPGQPSPSPNINPIQISTSTSNTNVDHTQSKIYVVNFSGSSSNLYMVPVPGRPPFTYATPVQAPPSSKEYLEPSSGPSSLKIYTNPNTYAVSNPGHSSNNMYTGSVNGPSPSTMLAAPAPGRACASVQTNYISGPPPYTHPLSEPSTRTYENSVPGTSTSNVYMDLLPGPSSSYEYDRENVEDQPISTTNFAPLTEETRLMKNPPFYGIEQICSWVSSDVTAINEQPSELSPLSPPSKKTRKSFTRNVRLHDDSLQCIGSKLTTLTDIIEYGPSYFDCLCLECEFCYNVHAILNKHKQDALNYHDNNEVIAWNSDNESTSFIIKSDEVSSEEDVSDEKVIEVSDTEDVNTIDLTDDYDDKTLCPVIESVFSVNESIEQQDMIHGDQSSDETEQYRQTQTQETQTIEKRTKRRVMCSPRTRQGISARTTVGSLRKKVVVSKVVKRRSMRGRDSHEINRQIDILPRILKGQIISAPVFFPTSEEFKDPIAYIEKIMPLTSKYGIFKLVAPQEYQPACTISENFKFSTSHQYIARLFNRWGPAARELCTMRAYLASQNVHFKHGPLLGGLEVDLPKVFHIVQRLGGLKAVMDKKKFHRIAEELNLKNLRNPEKKFDNLFLKYLLPYNSLTKRERQEMMTEVEQRWIKKNSRLMKRVANPLYRQKRMMGVIQTSEEEPEEEEEEEDYLTEALNLAEDCSQLGRKMGLGAFKKIAATAFQMYFPHGKNRPSVAEIEKKYWNIVLWGTQHVSVNTAFIESAVEGHGLPKSKTADNGNQNPWHLQNLSSNKKNSLRLLGSLAGMTVPSLHVGMVLSTSCWHRDPHGLPWMDYLHQGAEKIWYGIPGKQGSKFRAALQRLCPTLCRNKTLWLPSEIAMVPLNLLLDRNVTLTRCIQRPGEFVIVNPQAYSSSISTDFTVSESVYFATHSYFQNVNRAFQEMRESCEPSSFSLEQLLISASKDSDLPRKVLEQVHKHLNAIVSAEMFFRGELIDRKVTMKYNKNRPTVWSALDDDECHICRCALYMSRVKGLFKDTAVCLQHALKLINVRQKKQPDVKLCLTGVEMEVAINNGELHEILMNLEERLLIIN